MKKRRIRSLPDETLHEVHVEAADGPAADKSIAMVEVQEPRVVASVASTPSSPWSVLTNDGSFEVFVQQERDVLHVQVAGERFQFARGDVSLAAAATRSAGPADVKAPMPGKVVKLLRAAGELVKSGEGVLLFEAMKMQNEIRASSDGVISSMDVEEGQAVETHQKLFSVRPTN